MRTVDLSALAPLADTRATSGPSPTPLTAGERDAANSWHQPDRIRTEPGNTAFTAHSSVTVFPAVADGPQDSARNHCSSVEADEPVTFGPCPVLRIDVPVPFFPTPRAGWKNAPMNRKQHAARSSSSAAPPPGAPGGLAGGPGQSRHTQLPHHPRRRHGLLGPRLLRREIETPNLDRLAADGLRFTQFYNTARCWPTRSRS